MIVTACMCLHNWIRDSKLRDEHFDKFDNDAYVQPPLPFTGANALPPEDDGTMNAIRDDGTMIWTWRPLMLILFVLIY